MGKGFFGWLDIRNFMDTYQEWHAFAEGFSESFCFWRANFEPSKELLNDLRSEHHYYAFGRVVGFILLVLFVVGIIKILARKAKG